MAAIYCRKILTKFKLALRYEISGEEVISYPRDLTKKEREMIRKESGRARDKAMEKQKSKIKEATPPYPSPLAE